MSDFGAIIKFAKAGGGMTEEDLGLIKAALSGVIVEEDYSSNITEGNFQRIIRWEDGVYASFITEYYDIDDADEFRPDAEVEDLQDCNRIVSSLQGALGPDFLISSSFEDW